MCVCACMCMCVYMRLCVHCGCMHVHALCSVQIKSPEHPVWAVPKLDTEGVGHLAHSPFPHPTLARTVKRAETLHGCSPLL